MFKKIIAFTLLVTLFTVASSLSVFAQAKSSGETQAVTNNNDTKTEKLRETLLKKEDKPNFEKRETMADYEKQNAQGKKFSKQTKILIGVGVGVGVAILIGILATRYGINE